MDCLLYIYVIEVDRATHSTFLIVRTLLFNAFGPENKARAVSGERSALVRSVSVGCLRMLHLFDEDSA